MKEFILVYLLSKNHELITLVSIYLLTYNSIPVLQTERVATGALNPTYNGGNNVERITYPMLLMQPASLLAGIFSGILRSVLQVYSCSLVVTLPVTFSLA